MCPFRILMEVYQRHSDRCDAVFCVIGVKKADQAKRWVQLVKSDFLRSDSRAGDLVACGKVHAWMMQVSSSSLKV